MTKRRMEIGVGLLFLVAMAVSIAGNLILLPILNSTEFLSDLSASETHVRVSAVLMLVNSLSVVGIGVLCFQIFKDQSRLIATSYLAIRIVESIVLIVGIISVLSLITISNHYANAGEEATYLEAVGKAATSNNWYAYHIAMVFLGFGSLPFCYLLLKRSLIPAYLSILGIIGYIVLAVTSILSILDVNLGMGVTLPGFVFEVTFGFYLVFKGFRGHAEHADEGLVSGGR